MQDSQTRQKNIACAAISKWSKQLCSQEQEVEMVEELKKECEESLQKVKEELEEVCHKTSEMTMRKVELEETLKRKKQHHTFVSAKTKKKGKNKIYLELQEDILSSIEEHKSDLVEVNKCFFQLQNERDELENKIKSKEKELEDLKSEIENLRQQNDKLWTLVSTQQLSIVQLTSGISFFQQAQVLFILTQIMKTYKSSLAFF